MNTLTDKNYWDHLPLGNPDKVFFLEIIQKYIPADPSRTLLEIGCAGGGYLFALSKLLGYQPSGIDYSDQIKKTEELFKSQGYPIPHLIQNDFLTWESPIKYDLVCSFGFLEHFSNPHEVFHKHVSLASPGAYIILSVPHFRRLQWLLHWIIEPQIFQNHYTGIMDKNVLRRLCIEKNLEILFLDYYLCYDFWTAQPSNSIFKKAVSRLAFQSRRLIKTLARYKPNKWTSPHLLLIARMPG